MSGAVYADKIITSDLDANGVNDLIVDFGPGRGLWVWANNSNWQQLHRYSTAKILTSDLDANGMDDLIVDFGSEFGLWAFMNNSNWQQLHELSPTDLAEQ